MVLNGFIIFIMPPKTERGKKPGKRLLQGFVQRVQRAIHIPEFFWVYSLSADKRAFPDLKCRTCSLAAAA